MSKNSRSQGANEITGVSTFFHLCIFLAIALTLKMTQVSFLSQRTLFHSAVWILKSVPVQRPSCSKMLSLRKRLVYGRSGSGQREPISSVGRKSAVKGILQMLSGCASPPSFARIEISRKVQL
jgi:hypothetical protein